jgi:hypothetical protein
LPVDSLMLPDGNTNFVVPHPLNHEGCGESAFSELAAAIPFRECGNFLGTIGKVSDHAGGPNILS